MSKYDQAVQSQKESTVQDILDLIHGAYTPCSGAYQNGKAALLKLTRMELQALYVMCLTSRNRERRDKS